MDLHGIVSPYISTVNPMSRCSIRISSGYTIADDGQQQPTYLPDFTALAQVQPLSSKDLQHVAGMNLQGDLEAIYIAGQLHGVQRMTEQGGDLVTILEGAAAGVYLTTIVLENWPDWCKVAVTRQNEDPP
jgi:hypothetical protein